MACRPNGAVAALSYFKLALSLSLCIDLAYVVLDLDELKISNIIFNLDSREMTKRKAVVLSEDTDSPEISSPHSQLSPKRVKNSVELGKTSLFRALKLARGFERQKLGRRQKTARESNVDVEIMARLDAEISTLKVSHSTFRKNFSAKGPIIGS